MTLFFGISPRRLAGGSVSGKHHLNRGLRRFEYMFEERGRLAGNVVMRQCFAPRFGGPG